MYVIAQTPDLIGRSFTQDTGTPTGRSPLNPILQRGTLMSYLRVHAVGGALVLLALTNGPAAGQVATDVAGIDTTPPTVTAPIQRIAKGKVSSTVPMNVRWSASDASGVIAYKLWRSTDGGAFVRDRTLPPSATSHNYRLTMGHSYRFLVRAYDEAGNASAPARGPTFTPTVTDDRSCCFYFARGGSWKQELQPGAYNGSVTTL